MANKSKAKVWGEVSCPKHGVKDSKSPNKTPQVKVYPQPDKRLRGCPVCKSSKDYD